jgi:hypothetical protein
VRAQGDLNMQNGLMPANEAALQIRISRERLIRLVQSGELTGCLNNGHWFVDRSALAEFQRQLEAARARTAKGAAVHAPTG